GSRRARQRGARWRPSRGRRAAARRSTSEPRSSRSPRPGASRGACPCTRGDARPTGRPARRRARRPTRGRARRAERRRASSTEHSGKRAAYNARKRRAVRVLVLAAALAGVRAASAEEPAAPAFRWSDFERRNAGIVVFRSRWDKGALELKDDLVRWADRRDSGKNLVLPVQRLLGHTLVCKGPAPAPCSEWRISTRTDTY